MARELFRCGSLANDPRRHSAESALNVFLGLLTGQPRSDDREAVGCTPSNTLNTKPATQQKNTQRVDLCNTHVPSRSGAMPLTGAAAPQVRPPCALQFSLALRRSIQRRSRRLTRMGRPVTRSRLIKSRLRLSVDHSTNLDERIESIILSSIGDKDV
jgi:hypothetical protein